ncbi:hypothetical protein [Treponema sp.]|uniref:TP0183 family DNA metabolism protein n=1 Tax=Treponema sp. TaxID=166 RepID=UPI00388D6A27
MKNFYKKLFNLYVLVFFLTSIQLTSAESVLVDYYGVVSKSSDTNMLKMAQDVFFTQLKSIDGIEVDDKRPNLSKASTVLPDFLHTNAKIFFYAEITDTKNESGQTIWNCKFNAVTQSDGITHSATENYESYYKILVGAKNAIEKVLSDLKEPAPEFISANKANIEADFNTGIDIESLAGTWSGEPFTDKIIILRGGRGFVIFKNGATMNIKITVKKATIEGRNTTLEISQVGKSNASFFPELPREKALACASTASPITWNFSLTSHDTLEGTKTTVISTNSGTEPGILNSSWIRR